MGGWGMPPPATRVALLGYGLAGRVLHAPLIAATPGLDLATVVTSDAGRAARAAADHPGVRVAPDADGVIAARDHGLVVVATANRAHVPQAEAALRTGHHVVVDKPLAVDARTAAALVVLAEAAGRMLTVFQNRRWDSDLLTLRRLRDAGTLGTVVRFESRFDRWRPAPRPGAWRESADPGDGGGLLLDLGVHLADQCVALFGTPRTVYAEIDARRVPGGADDDVFVALGYDDGLRAHLWASTLAGDPGVRMRAMGTRAAWTSRHLDPQEAALRSGARPGGGAPWGMPPRGQWGEIARGEEREPAVPVPGDWPAFYAGVARAIRDGAPPPVDPWDAVTVLRILEAARRSAAEGTVVRLEP